MAETNIAETEIRPFAPPRRRRTQERIVLRDDGEGNWLVSYADMMTLLFGFFVIVAAFSTPDPKKLEMLKEETAKSTGGQYKKPYEDLTQSIRKILQEANVEKEMYLEQTEDGVEIISRGTLFFDSGSSSLKPIALDLVNRIARVLAAKAKDFHVIVEGHTDDNPIVSKFFPSNWELSASRASTVVRLLESKGFPHSSLRPVGLADTEPILPGRDKNGKPISENQAQNRRIVIRIARQLPKRMNSGK